jgi:hypothetical protein
MRGADWEQGGMFSYLSPESEDLGNGSNFKDRITIERAWIALGEVAIGDDVAAGRFDDTHDNTYRLLLSINTFYEDFADFAGAENWKWLEDIRIHKFGNRPHTLP